MNEGHSMPTEGGSEGVDYSDYMSSYYPEK